MNDVKYAHWIPNCLIWLDSFHDVLGLSAATHDERRHWQVTTIHSIHVLCIQTFNIYGQRTNSVVIKSSWLIKNRTYAKVAPLSFTIKTTMRLILLDNVSDLDDWKTHFCHFPPVPTNLYRYIFKLLQRVFAGYPVGNRGYPACCRTLPQRGWHGSVGV